MQLCNHCTSLKKWKKKQFLTFNPCFFFSLFKVVSQRLFATPQSSTSSLTISDDNLQQREYHEQHHKDTGEEKTFFHIFILPFFCYCIALARSIWVCFILYLQRKTPILTATQMIMNSPMMKC